MPKIDSIELESATLKITSSRLNLLPKFSAAKEAASELTSSSELDGTAWKNTKNYFNVYPTVTDGVGNTLNTLSDTLTNYLSAFQAEVGSPKHQLNTEELIDLKNKLATLQRRKQDMIDTFNKFPLAEMLGGGIVQQLNNLGIDSAQKEIDILEKYQTFESSHGSDFDEVKGLLSSLKTGLMQMGGQKIVGNPAHGYVPRNYANQPWMQKLKEFNAKQPKDRIEYVAYPSDNHGGKDFVVYRNGVPDKLLNMKLAQLMAMDTLGVLQEMFINDPYRFFVGIDPVTGKNITFGDWLKSGFWTALDFLPLSDMLKISKNIKLGKKVLDGVSLTEKELELFSKMQNLGDYTVVKKASGGKELLKPDLLDELSKSGVKYNLDDVVMVGKDSSGKLLWLEKGNDKAGLKHIINGHIEDFSAKGIEDIPNFLHDTLKINPVKQGTGPKGPFSVYIIDGQKYTLAYGNNGFVVSFYPSK